MANPSIDPEIYRLARRFRQITAEIATQAVITGAVLRGALRLARMIVPFDALLVARGDPDAADGYIIRIAAHGLEPDLPYDCPDAPRGRGGFLAEVLRQGEPLILHDQSWRDEPQPIVPWLPQMRAALVVPTFSVLSQENVQIFFHRQPEGFGPDDLRLMVILGNLMGALLGNVLLRQQVEESHARLDTELAQVGQVQRQLLPARLPHPPGWDIQVHYATSTRSGGDAYDVYDRPDGSLVLWISDVAGHGAAAAVVMAMTRVALHGLEDRPEDPSALLERVSGVLARHLAPEQFVTAWAAVLDPVSGRFESGSAGHPTPRIWRAGRGRVEPLPESPGLPLGLLESGGSRSITSELGPGDALILYTDGVVETFRPDGQPFGVRRLDRAIASSRGSSAEAIRDAIVTRLTAFRGRGSLDDDFTLLVVRRRPD